TRLQGDWSSDVCSSDLRLAKLRPAFDRTSGRGTLTAGNSSPLTDGAAGIFVATDEGLARLPAGMPRARLVDFEIAAVDVFTEGRSEERRVGKEGREWGG